MLRTNEQLKITWWPLPQDYNEAIQNPQVNLSDEELKHGLVYTDRNGLPRPVTGSFASVYRLKCEQRDTAVRCFLSNIADQEERYRFISDFVRNDDLPSTVTFDYLPSGIRVNNRWLPALKMEWVDGDSLDDYVSANIANPAALAELSEKFLAMVADLRRAGIAHGDLQHGNVIVCGGDLRLVDYDGMYVPGMQGWHSNELGHRNYQHPQRSAQHFGPYLDNFSAWVIYASLKALEKDPVLLHQLGGCDDCMLFRQADFLNPMQSSAFAAFEKHKDEELNALGRFLRSQLQVDPAQVAELALPVPQVDESALSPIDSQVPTVRTGPRLVRGTLPDRIDVSHIADLHTTRDATLSEPAGTLSEREWLNKSWAVPAGQVQSAWSPPVRISKLSQVAPVRAMPCLPPELLLPVPRAVEFDVNSGLSVRWTTAFLLCFLLALLVLSHTPAAALLLYATLFFAWMRWKTWLDQRLAETGYAAMAEIVDLLPSNLIRKQDAVVVSYTLQDGSSFKKTLYLPNWQFNSLKVGTFEPILHSALLGYTKLYRFCAYQAVDVQNPAVPQQVIEAAPNSPAQRLPDWLSGPTNNRP